VVGEEAPPPPPRNWEGIRRFLDCSVRALCDHSEACEIEHELECRLGEQVKTRNTIRLGRMYGTKQ